MVVLLMEKNLACVEISTINHLLHLTGIGNINENLTLNTSLYGSAGRGGGTGPRGKNYECTSL